MSNRRKLYQIRIFGKKGCQKCQLLKQRVAKVLDNAKYAEFEQAYFDILTEDGLVTFCAAECLNPSRIPAFLVCRLDELTGEYRPIPNPVEHPERMHPLFKQSLVYSWLGLETDYSDIGKGSITPKMIEGVLDLALSHEPINA